MGLWIRRPYSGFNTVLLVPLRKGADLITSTLKNNNNSKHHRSVLNKVCEKHAFLCLSPSFFMHLYLTKLKLVCVKIALIVFIPKFIH